MATKTATADITTAQLNLINKLLLELHPGNPGLVFEKTMEAGQFSKSVASGVISMLIAESKAQKAAKLAATPVKVVPAGTYLALGKIVKVKISKKTNAPYLIAEDGTYLGALKGDAPAMLAEIEADPKAAAIAYGKATGNCCICSKTLTNPESIAAGIGPVCAGKF